MVIIREIRLHSDDKRTVAAGVKAAAISSDDRTERAAVFPKLLASIETAAGSGIRDIPTTLCQMATSFRNLKCGNNAQSS